MEREEYNRLIIKQIRDFMDEKKLTCNALADAAGVSQSSLDRLLKNATPSTIDYSFLARIVNLGLSMTMEDFNHGSILKDHNIDEIASAKRKYDITTQSKKRGGRKL